MKFLGGRYVREICKITIMACSLMYLAGCGGGGLGASAPNSIFVAWKPHPDPSVTGYMIYYGPSIDTAITVASNQPADGPNFNPQAPSIKYDPAGLGLQTGDTVCFRLKAYNPDGESDFSPGACTTV